MGAESAHEDPLRDWPGEPTPGGREVCSDDLSFRGCGKTGGVVGRAACGFQNAFDGLAEFGASGFCPRQLVAELLFPGLEVRHQGLHATR